MKANTYKGRVPFEAFPISIFTSIRVGRKPLHGLLFLISEAEDVIWEKESRLSKPNKLFLALLELT